MSIALLACPAFLAGCNVGPKYFKPAVPTAPEFREQTPEMAEQSKLWQQSHPQDAADKGQWWRVFHDDQLNQLEAQIDHGNETLAQYEAQYREARAALTIARSALYPTVTGESSAVNYSDSGSQTGIPKTLKIPGMNGSSNNNFSLEGVFSWEPDLWGSVHNQVLQQKATTEAALSTLANVRLEMETELASDYLSLQGQQDLIQLLSNTEKNDRQLLALTEDRYQHGVASDQDVEQAKTQLASVRTQLKDAGIQRAQYEHAVAVLVGKTPASLPPIQVTPLQEPPPLPAGLASTLVERRPDVASAERNVAAANAQIGVAKAAFLPSLTISADGGYSGNHVSNWLEAPSRFWSLGPSAALTVFDGNKRRATVAQYKAGYDASVSAYRQTVLTAFQEVEDSLAAQRILKEETGTAAESVRSAQAQLETTLDLYEHGTQSYINVATAQNQLLASQQTALGIRVREATNTVQLVKAIGGSWNE